MLSVYLTTVIGALTIFYSILGVSLFVPVIGGLFTRRAGSAAAMAAIAAGVAALLVVRFGLGNEYPWLDPTLAGLLAAAVAFTCVTALRTLATTSQRVSADAEVIVSALALSIDMKTYRIAVIAGDGIGQEVIPAGIEVLKTAASQAAFGASSPSFHGDRSSTSERAAWSIPT